jgi:hypothetical protein
MVPFDVKNRRLAMSMAADRQYLAVSRHIAALKQGEIVASKPQAKIAGAAGKPNARALACKLIIAATITSLLVGAAVARAGMKTYFPRTVPYMPIQSLQPVW